MPLDALLLSRLQFAFTLAFHIIFPSFSIGLASFLAVLEGLWLITRREAFQRLYLFWLKIFAISFGMGVVTGVVLSYELGTNWSVFSRATAGVNWPPASVRLRRFFLEVELPGRDAVRLEARGSRPAFHRHLPGRVRHAALGVLDSFRQQLDAGP